MVFFSSYLDCLLFIIRFSLGSSTHLSSSNWGCKPLMIAINLRIVNLPEYSMLTIATYDHTDGTKIQLTNLDIN